MADEDVATKAPENDAQETSGITGDTKPDQGAASMGVRLNHTPCTPYQHEKLIHTTVGTLHDRPTFAYRSPSSLLRGYRRTREERRMTDNLQHPARPPQAYDEHTPTLCGTLLLRQEHRRSLSTIMSKST